MGVSGISSGYGYDYGYNSMINSSSWTEKAEKEAEQLKSSATSKTESTGSSTSYVNSSNSSTSTFLLGYQASLEDLEAASAKLQTFRDGNVFQNYEKKLAAASQPGASDADRAAVDSAADDIVAAAQDFAKKYNDTVSYLSSNASRSSNLAAQLESFKRAIGNEKGLKAIGMKVDTNGKLQVDEKAMKEALGKYYGTVKEALGGQYSVADRVGSKASAVLDSPVDKIVGGSTDASGETTKTENSSSSDTTASYAKKSSSMSDSFMQFANFAKGGAFNLTNYYAVSMLNILA